MELNGKCVVCHGIAVCVCERCGDYYCSPKCQIQDWHTHRYICFPMPKLILGKCGLFNNNSLATASGIVHSSFDELTQTLDSQTSQSSKSSSLNGYQTLLNTPLAFNGHEKKNKIEKQESDYQKQESITFKENDQVILVSFYSTNRCYIRSALPKDEREYNAIIKKINEEGQNAKPLEQQPKMFSYVITHLYNPNGIMARAKIIQVQGNQYFRVVFSDFGVTDARHFNELKCISEVIKNQREYVIFVHLRGIEMSHKNKEIAHLIPNVRNKKFLIKYFEYNERETFVELECVETGKLLNQTIGKYLEKLTLNKENLTKQTDKSPENHNVDADNKTKSSNRNQTSLNDTQSMNISFGNLRDEETKTSSEVDRRLSLAQTPPFKTCLPENIENVNILVLDDSLLTNGYLGAITESDLQILDSVQKYLKNFNPMVKSYKPKVDEYVIAKFDGDWYRAKVMEEQSNKIEYTLNYIDFTNESIVPFEDIRRYPDDFKIDCKSFVCLINGLPEELNDDQKKYLLSEIHLHKKLTVNVLEKIDNTILLIEIPGFINKINSYKKVSTN